MSTTTILEPGQIEAAAGEIPTLLMPPADIFSNRATRLRQLAEGHRLGDYLRFIARLLDGQSVTVKVIKGVPVPSEKLLAQCKEYRVPPLSPAGWKRNPAWLMVLEDLIKAMVSDAPEPARTLMLELMDKDYNWLESQADKLLSGQFSEVNLAYAPFIGAALQVYWTHLAQALTPGQLALPEHPNLCPVCGSHPVASVVRIGGKVSGIRYLQCSLCSSEWHVVRAKCSNCDNTKGISYFNIENDAAVVTAESCPECETYLKVIHMDKDPHAEAYADDTATLTLDLLMGEQGASKSGINLLMIHGAADSK